MYDKEGHAWVIRHPDPEQGYTQFGYREDLANNKD